MSFDSCLVDLVRVETHPNYVSSLIHLCEIRPELRDKKSSNVTDNVHFQSQYAEALFFIMNSCEKCDRLKFFKRPGDSGYVEGVTAISKECQLAQGRQLQISQLPVEDTVWSLDTAVDQTDNTHVMLVIQDRCSLVVGFTVWDTYTTTISEHVRLALCAACLFPVVHRPRRPRYFCITDKHLAQSCMPDLNGLGITCIMGPDRTVSPMSSHSVDTSVGSLPVFRECTVCHFRAEREMFYTCEFCGAMLYCTQACQETDCGQEGQTTLYNHSKWCQRLKIYMEEEKKLVHLPFTFTSETTHPDFGVHQLEAFLQRIGLYGQGLWQWVCPVTSGLPITRTHGTGFFKDHQNLLCVIKEQACSSEGLQKNSSSLGSQSSDFNTKVGQLENPCSHVGGSEDPEFQIDHSEISYTKVDQSGETYGVGDQLRSCDVPTGQSASIPLSDWSAYYTQKGFNFDSPVAVLLQWPLTLYYILTSCLPQDYGCRMTEGRPVIVDILGVEQEVDLYPVFQELGNLLPGHDLVINLFGKNISKVVDRCVKVMGRVKVKVYRRLYHDYTRRWTPDLAVGFNAGIAAYPSWRDTITKLKDERIPAYFTDYCHYSAELGREVVREGCGLKMSTPTVNPFRSPMRRVCDQHLLPWFSNAFLFHLIYSHSKES